MANTKARRERTKRAAFAAAAFLIGLLAAELLAFLGYFAVRRDVFPRAAYRASMERAPDATRRTDFERGHTQGLWQTGTTAKVVEVVHPYLGFVQHPDLNPDTSPQGFPMNDPLPTSLAPDRLVVGVFGGSFAEGFSVHARDLLAAALEPLAKEVVVVNFATGGYKQPQQLMALVWALSLGSKFDLVINIDGFNEVVLPVVTNLPRGVNPYYPRAWDQRVADYLTSDSARLLAQLAAAVESRAAWARLFLGCRLHRSVVMCLAWRACDLALERRAARFAQRLEDARSAAAKGFLARGPDGNVPSGQNQLYDALAGYWRRCSLQMHRLCEANGIRYYHFLQPNQYVEGSKPMRRQERTVAFHTNHRYRTSVRRGYPWLQRHGAQLAAQGVRFTDLTMIYSRHDGPVYIDDCCHVNRFGYSLVADAIGRTVRADEARR